MKDSHIVSLCLIGDTSAFEKLVIKYQPNLIALAYNILGNREEARDAVQEAFIQAYSHLVNVDRNRS